MPTDSLLDVYLDDVRRVRALKVGTAETSYYPALGALLNGVGGQLRPRVFCLHHPSGDAGIPDFGLFEQAQFRRDEAPTWAATVTPERGVVEVKGASHKIDVLVKGKQVREQYLPAYGLVLATNLWQFRLLDVGATVGRHRAARLGSVDAVQLQRYEQGVRYRRDQRHGQGDGRGVEHLAMFRKDTRPPFGQVGGAFYPERRRPYLVSTRRPPWPLPELCWNLGDAVIRRRSVLACR